MAREDLRAALDSSAWPVAVFASVLTAPFVIGLWGCQPPPWLDTAWQVSATLAGLGIAIVIFVLQIGAGQSLRSDAIYKALLRHTWLAWPATFALAFIIGVAISERFASSASAPGWADTWALALFALQVLLFGVSFFRAVGSASPGAVRRVLVGSFRATIRLAVRESLTRNVMRSQFSELCGDAISRGILFSRGAPVTAGREGFVDDIDRRLVNELARMRLGDRVTLTVEPGDHVDVEYPLAKREEVNGTWLAGLLRRSVVIRKTKRAQSPVEVFEDALDLSRRALDSGSIASLRSSLALLLECLGDLPASYTRWGTSYSAGFVEEVLSVSPEREMVTRLALFANEVFRSGSSEAALQIPGLAAGMMEAGLDEDAPLLLDQGAQLLRHCVERVDLLPDIELRQQLRERVDRLGGQAVRRQQHRLEDSDLPWERRTAASAGLAALFDHQIRRMKIAVDAGDIAAFVYAWNIWEEWGRHWDPENEMDDLEFHADFGIERNSRQTKRELERGHELVEMKGKLVGDRAELMFALGVWALDRRKAGDLAGERWTEFVPYLSGPFSDPASVSATIRESSNFARARTVERWQTNVAPLVPGWQPSDVRLLALFWAVALLLRTVAPDGERPAIDLGPGAPQLEPQVNEILETIEGDPPAWEGAVGVDLAARCAAVRDVLAEAAKRQAEERRKRLAEAPLSAGKVDGFATQLRGQYEETDFLRRALLLEGAVDVVLEEDAVPDERPRNLLLPKAAFVDLDSSPVVVWSQEHGRELARRELARAFDAALNAAQEWQGEVGAAGALEVVASMRDLGHEPDAILVPRGFKGSPDAAVSASLPEWKWSHSFIGSEDHIAELAGVKVYEAGSPGVSEIVVMDIGESLRRKELRRDGGQSVVVEVRLIDEARAVVLYDQGHRVAGEESRDAQVAEMTEGRVEGYVDIRVEWTASDELAPIWRIDLAIEN